MRAGMSGEPVLVVDDEPEVRALLCELLTLEGHAVARAATGAEGLEVLRRERAGIVLLDLALPDMDGIAVMREMLCESPQPDIIILTGHATMASAIEAVELGAAGYVLKPLDLLRIAGLIARAVERRHLVRQNTRFQRERAERTREMEQLVGLAQVLNSTLETKPLLKEVARKTAALIGVDRCSIYLFRDGYVIPVMSQFADGHTDPELWGRFKAMGRIRIDGVPVYARAIAERQPVVVADAAASDLAPAYWSAVGIKSALVVPLIHHDEVVGAMNLDRTSAGEGYPEARVRLAMTIASQIVLSLENARLYVTAERERRRLEVLNDVNRKLAAINDTDEILSLIVREATELLGAAAAAIWLLEDDDLVLAARTDLAGPITAERRIRVGESLIGRVVASGQPVTVEDLGTDEELGFHGFMGVPLRADDRVIGALALYTKKRQDTKKRQRFSSENTALLSAFADQASLAIEKNRLLREAREGRQIVEWLAAVGLDMQNATDADGRLRAFIEGAHEIVGFDRISVMLASADRSMLEVACAHGYEGVNPPGVLPLSPDAGIIHLVLANRRPAAVLDDDALARVPPLGGAYRESSWFRSRRFVVAPLLVGERAIGVAVADNKLTRRPIRRSSVEPFALLCQQLAAAVDEERLAREKAELLERTESQRMRLAQIFGSTSDGIMLVNLTGGLESANGRAGELLDFDASRTEGRGLADVLAPHLQALGEPDGIEATLGALFENPGRGGEGDLALTAAGRILHWVARPTTDAGGQIAGLTLTFQDVTQEREVSRMKSDFVSFVTHQLRTPLSGIKWMLELAAEAPAGDSDIGSYVQDAREAADRLIVLVNELLDISRLESGRLAIESTPTDVAALTAEVVKELALLVEEKGHRLAVHGTDGAALVMADPRLLREVVMNLTSNAIKYTAPGGDVTMEISHAKGELEWTIRDSGIGISKESQRRLFEKFYRADNALTMEADGTGLGLYLVRLIVERFGGRVWCESEVGRGSTFAFALPVAS